MSNARYPDRTTETVNLDNCDREPIHIPGRIQSFGYLIAATAGWSVNHVSRNIGEIIQADPEAMVGQRLSDHIRGDTLHDIRGRVQILAGRDSVERIFGAPLTDSGALFDIAVHLSGRSVVVEIEPHAKHDGPDHVSYVRPMIERISRAESVEQLCAIAARQLKILTGFDRVMAYRFAPDGSGEVVAEAREPELESFLGLHYPATDIPRQARDLYRRNLLRIISDVNDAGIEVIPATGPEGDPLDMSMGTTRAVSPIHLEYLRNMGVGASMSVSILKRGELWGLFACHHYAPRILSYELRSAAELFGQLFAFVLDQKESDVERRDARRAQALHDQLMVRLAEGSSVPNHFGTIADAIGSVIRFDGALCWIDGEFRSVGSALTREQFEPLQRFLNTASAGQVFTTDCLSKVFPPAADYTDRAAGILVLPVSRLPRDYIVLIRQEMVRSVTWAGEPSKAMEVGPNGPRLTPRKSFEAWQEVVKGHGSPWTDAEVRAADALRVTMLEVVLRMTDAAMHERKQLHDRQELLIAELNHRVRNILNLIRGLISQSRKDATDVASFTEIVGGRIHALARAHDQITSQHWEPASLRTMIETEAAAYLGKRQDRLAIAGPDVMLKPNAYTTMSLVIHEMITNAAKYGALSDQHGDIGIDFEYAGKGPFVLRWRERNGPSVRPPLRKGFGSTIIERSIPHELGGKAEVRYERGGIEATFTLPAAMVSAAPKVEDRTAEPEPTSDEVQIGGEVLLVEDNIVIALDVEEMLRRCGAGEVMVAGSVGEALGVIDRRPELRMALLDVNLGRETSDAIARRLSELAVPFIFATGYGEAPMLTDRFPGVQIIQKPFDVDVLAAAVARCFGEAA